jgi:hypothetical protein
MHDRALRSAASSRSSPQFKCALRPSPRAPRRGRAAPMARPGGKVWNRGDLRTVDPLGHRSVLTSGARAS